MKWLVWCALLISFVPPTVSAQSLFDGRWKIDLDESQASSARHEYLLKDGIYRCTTCDPKLELKADGLDHKITGEPCYDTVSVKIVDDRTTEEIDKRNGKTVGTTKMTVSADGDTATIDWTENCSANGDVVTGKDIFSRVAQGPPGSHSVSGSWKLEKRLNRSENALIITLKLEGETFSFADPTNQRFTAKLGGPETPYEGDLSGTMVSVKRASENTIEETNKRDRRIIEIDRFTVSADGKTLTISMRSGPEGITRQFVAHKQ